MRRKHLRASPDLARGAMGLPHKTGTEIDHECGARFRAPVSWVRSPACGTRCGKPGPPSATCGFSVFKPTSKVAEGDAGMVVQLADGSEFQITFVQMDAPVSIAIWLHSWAS